MTARPKSSAARKSALADLGRARLDHHDRVARARDDDVHVGRVQLLRAREGDELAADARDAHGRDRALERDRREQHRGERGVHREDVGLVLLVDREHGPEDLDLVVVFLGEERPDRAVDQAAGEDLLVRRAPFALDEAARELAGGVDLLAVLDGEREEVDAFPRVGDRDGGEDDGVPHPGQDGACGLPGDDARLEGQGAAGDRAFNFCGCMVSLSPALDMEPDSDPSIGVWFIGLARATQRLRPCRSMTAV